METVLFPVLLLAAAAWVPAATARVQQDISYAYSYKLAPLGGSYLQASPSSGVATPSCSGAADCLAKCPNDAFIGTSNATPASVQQQVRFATEQESRKIHALLLMAANHPKAGRLGVGRAGKRHACGRPSSLLSPRLVKLMQLFDCANAVRTSPDAFADAINAVCSYSNFSSAVTQPACVPSWAGTAPMCHTLSMPNSIRRRLRAGGLR